MKKRKLTNLHLAKQVISSLEQRILGGEDKTDPFTVTCARPVSDCTVALTVQPEVCNTLPRPLSNCTVAYSVQVWCNQSMDVKC
ncbi:hypothetical protein [Kordia zhangzhouensis]|uniref:hypothetical protein n=1 Tax=Kordia zhangzhouensis TaxID=1620405 RepID=UPI000629CF17|nr:hypothetical protein [Kordia zhangzhouensis]